MGADRKQKEGREEPRRRVVQRTESSWPGEEKENLQETAQLRRERGVQPQDESYFYPEDGI